MQQRYNDLNTYLRGLYGCRVQKIPIDAGLSCPNRDGTIGHGGCIYCNARGSGTGAHAAGISVDTQMRRGQQALAKRYKAKKFIAYFQSFTNTYAPLDNLKALYDEALAVEDVVGLSIGTRPDCITEDVLTLLAEYARTHLIWLEYGLQSAHNPTLQRINRGHDADAFRQAVEQTRDRGINICAHVILGLPGEGRQEMLKTADFISELGIDGLKLHLLYVIRGTTLQQLWQQGDYTCLTQREYVDHVCAFLERIPQSIVIQRLTGDPHREELVAPQWSLRKSDTLNRIKETLAIRNTWQGKHYSPQAHISR